MLRSFGPWAEAVWRLFQWCREPAKWDKDSHDVLAWAIDLPKARAAMEIFGVHQDDQADTLRYLIECAQYMVDEPLPDEVILYGFGPDDDELLGLNGDEGDWLGLGVRVVETEDDG